MKSREAKLAGTVSSVAEAGQYLKNPGDFILVKRKGFRNLIMLCPDGCGERLVVNLDPRVGPAWRYYEKKKQVTLFPSIWRSSGCRSHFILWRDAIYWLDSFDSYSYIPSAKLEQRVYRALTKQFSHFSTIADQLSETPWDVLEAARSLARKGRAIEGAAETLGHFKRR